MVRRRLQRGALCDIITHMTSSVLFFAILAAMPAVPVPSVANEGTFEAVPLATPTYAGVAISDEKQTAKPAPKKNKEEPESDSSRSLITINTDSVLDMNWSGAMELVDPMDRPLPVILPFFESYPIENIEVKLRLLNLPF